VMRLRSLVRTVWAFLMPALFAPALLMPAVGRAADAIIVGGKIFTESYILGEIAAQSIARDRRYRWSASWAWAVPGYCSRLEERRHRCVSGLHRNLGGSHFEATALKSVDEIRRALIPMDLVISAPLGFNDTYAIAVKDSFATEHQLRTISDLRRVQSTLRAAFSYEFMDRKDGYPGMVDNYQLHMDSQKVTRMEHSLSFQAIDDNAVDLIDVYSTDAKIKKFNLRLLEDDRDISPCIRRCGWRARRSWTNIRRVADTAQSWRVRSARRPCKT